MFELVDKKIIVIIGLAGLYIFYRVFLKENSAENSIEKEYNQVLNSDEYKVKGQW